MVENKIEKDFRLFAKDKGVSHSVIDGYSRFMNRYIEPTIIEERTMNISQISVYSRLFMERILVLGTQIDSDVSNIINTQLLFLETENPNKNITMFINSPGGSVYDGMSIVDTMNIISCPVYTTCMGTAASMGAVLLSSGEKGHRDALPHSQILLHSPSGGTGVVTAPDMRIAAKEMEKCENMLYEVLAENTGKDFEYIKKVCDRDFWLTPKEAIENGVIDSIVQKKKKYT